MAQPLNREGRVPPLGKIDEKAGEFWVGNPFLMPAIGQNVSAYERKRLYLNVGGNAFIDASYLSSADIDSDGRSVVAADFDGDGAPDLLVGSVGGGPLRLFLNQFPRTAGRIRVELVGTESNRPGIGARVVAHCGGRQVVRDVFPANGFQGQGPAGLLLGVGEVNRVDRLTVRWPTGRTQEFTNVPVNCSLKVTEGRPEYEVGALTAAKPAATGASQKK